MRVVLLGGPGAGKGTQAQLISERLAIPHISTGDLLRAAVADRTELGRIAKQYMERGELAPDELVINVIEERLGAGDCERGFLFDGFPRNPTQATVLESMLKRRKLALDHVVNLLVPRDDLVERLSGRRTCRNCGSMFHVKFDPPKRAGVCDRCGGDLFQRADDHEETIRARLDVYEEITAPLCDFYRSRGLLREVEGLGARSEVLERILARVNGTAG
jgi:adenylate kinase